jgi:soluble lytic murein transglycosylase
MSRRRHRKLSRLGNWLSLALVVGAVGSASVVYLRWRFREQRYNQLIELVAGENGVDKFLIKAVIRQESGFDPFAYSAKGAMGLMQVTEGAGREWARATGRKDYGRDLLWDERANIEAGTWYLARALQRWRDRDDPVPFALAEYNAGLGNVQRWLPEGEATTAEQFAQAITFPSVRRYIESVTDYYRTYAANGDL